MAGAKPVQAVRVHPDLVIAFVSGSTLRSARVDAFTRENPDMSLGEARPHLERIEAETQYGEYREVLSHPDPNAGEFGDRHVWVEEDPDDHTDLAGHFEAYDADEHGEPYHPTPSRRDQPVTVIEKEGGATLGVSGGEES